MNLFSEIEEYFKFEKKEISIFEGFSGYGSQKIALDIVAEEIGLKIKSVGISEIDKAPIVAHNLFHGETHNFGNIEEMNELPLCDIATWSFPCQDISKAGKQKGMMDGTRSNYGYIFLDVLSKTKNKPKILLMENVAALNEKTFDYDRKKILDILSQNGYRNYVNVLNAKNFDIPQNRKRIFIVSILDDDRPYKWNDGVPTKKRVKDFMGKGVVDEKYYLSAKMINFLYNNNNKQIEKGNGFRFNTLKEDDIAKTITTLSGNRMDDNFIIDHKSNKQFNRSMFENTELKTYGVLRGDGLDRPRHRVYESDGLFATITTNEGQMPYYVFDNDLPKGKYTVYNQIGNIVILEDELKRAYVIDLEDSKNIPIPEATIQGYAKAEEEEDIFYINRPHQKRGVVQKGCSPTIKTSGNDLGYYVGKRIRKLTLRENGRLMGLKDSHIDLLLNSGLSHGSIIKMFGNSIVVDVLVSIFRNLF